MLQQLGIQFANALILTVAFTAIPIAFHFLGRVWRAFRYRNAPPLQGYAVAMSPESIAARTKWRDEDRAQLQDRYFVRLMRHTWECSLCDPAHGAPIVSATCETGREIEAKARGLIADEDLDA